MLSKNITIHKQWNYSFFQVEDEYYLEVLCGSVAMFEVKIQLNKEEIEKYENRGEEFIDSLAEEIRNYPNEFSKRAV